MSGGSPTSIQNLKATTLIVNTIKIESAGDINTDSISEATTNSGVNVDGVLLKDNTLTLDPLGATTTTILDDSTMAANSATALATQQSIRGYVDVQILGGGFWDRVGGNIRPDVSTDTLSINTILEQDLDNGVDIETVNIKDGDISSISTLTATTITNAEVQASTAHITADGSSHTFIDQAVLIASSPSFTAVSTDTITEKTGDAGVTIDGVLVKDGGIVCADGATLEVDTINEATAAAGVTVDGVLVKDGGVICSDGATLEVDTINEATAAAGVTIDGVLVKDNTLTAVTSIANTTSMTIDANSGSTTSILLTNAGAGICEVVVGVGDILTTDDIIETTPDGGVTIDLVLVKDGGIICSDGATLEVDTINEATTDAGVTVEGNLNENSRLAINSSTVPAMGFFDIYGSSTTQTTAPGMRFFHSDELTHPWGHWYNLHGQATSTICGSNRIYIYIFYKQRYEIFHYSHMIGTYDHIFHMYLCDYISG